MSSQLEKALEGFSPETTVEILLDGKVRGLTFTPENAAALTAFTKLKTLSLVGNNISSLEHFPAMSALTTLNLDDNNISGGMDHLANSLMSLRTLSLAGNPVASVDALQPLFLLDSLKYLNLQSCPIQSEDYEDDIFNALPQLEVLDGSTRTARR